MRTAFYISDGTAITAEALGHAVLAFFPLEFEHVTIPFVETPDIAEKIKARINETYRISGAKPLVFQTFSDKYLRTIINSSEAICYDFLNTFVEPIQRELGVSLIEKPLRAHSIHDKSYDYRIDAINYAMDNDDGANLKNYDMADVILVGVSRSGKTPTSLYLALQYGIKAANYPFVEEDMDNLKLSEALKRNKSKLFGLTIEAQQLTQIREQRRPNSRYASSRQCQQELSEVEALYKREQIPYLNSTHLSIEEMSAKIISSIGLTRHKY